MGQTTTRRLGALKSALLACAAFTAPAIGVIAPPAVAQTRAQPEYQFNLPAQPLARSVAAVAARANIQVLYTEEAPNEVRAPALRGRMTADQALARLTAGTGFTWVYTQPGVIRLERVRATSMEEDGSRVLGPVRVEGAQSTFAYSGGPLRGDGIAQLGGVRGGQDEEATGYRANIATVGAGAPTALEDIPRSISVLTQEQLERQDIQDIGDALRRLPGVTLVESNQASLATGSAVLSRGFAINRVQIDGGAARPLNIIGNGGLSLQAYERVELVRGPNGVFSGAASPGGSLNLVRKRPGSTESREVTVTLGDTNRYDLLLDYSTPSVGDTPVAFRGILAIQDQNFWYENGGKQNALIYGIADAPLGDRARLELGLQYTDVNDTAPYSGRYRYLDGGLIEFGDYYTNLTPAWAYSDADRTETFARLYLEVADHVDLEVGFDLETGNHNTLLFNPVISLTSFGSPQNDFVLIAASSENYRTSNLGADFRLSGKFKLLGLDHSVFLAGDISEAATTQSNSASSTNVVFGTSLADLLAGLETFQPTLSRSSFLTPAGTTSRRGMIVGDTISWRDRVELSLSARRYDNETSTFVVEVDPDSGRPTNITVGELAAGARDAKAEWVPSWALAVKPLRNLTIFGTQSEGVEEVTTPRYTTGGVLLGPTTYENLEGGLKFATDRWLLTLSYYDLARANVPQSIPGSSCLPTNTTTTSCYLASGVTEKSTGVDVELVGEIVSGVNVSANYNYMDLESTATGQNFSTQSPVNSAQVFVDWRPGFAPAWSVRGGARYRGEVFRAGTQFVFDPVTSDIIDSIPFDYTEGAYLVFDAGVSYQVNPQVSLDLYAENIFNEEYLSSISDGSANFPGAPRTFSATLRWKVQGRRVTDAADHSLAPFGVASDWYGALDTGVHETNTLNARATGVSQDGVTPISWGFDTEDGLIGGARLGYRWAPHFRTELEGGYRASEIGDIGGGAAAPFGVCGAAFTRASVPFNCADALGEIDMWSIMANALYDFRSTEDRLRPSVGAGVGLVRSSLDFSGKLEGIGQTTPWANSSVRRLQEFIGGDTTEVSIAYQLQAGVSYQVTERATFEAVYRYFVAPDLAWSSWNLGEPGGSSGQVAPLTGRVGDFEASYEDQSVMVGFRWAFGSR